MKNQKLLLSVANSILKSNNYRFEFEIISEVSQENIEGLDLYYMGGVSDLKDFIGVYYTKAVIPTNLLKYQDKFYLLF